jgi:hypothetical protein
MRVGVQRAAGFGLEIIPLHQFDGPDPADDAEPAAAVLAHQQRRSGGPQLFDQRRAVIAAQDVLDRGIQRARQLIERAESGVGLVLLDLRDDGFGHARLLRQVAERVVIGLAEAPDGLAQLLGHLQGFTHLTPFLIDITALWFHLEDRSI